MSSRTLYPHSCLLVFSVFFIRPGSAFHLCIKVMIPIKVASVIEKLRDITITILITKNGLYDVADSKLP